MNGKPTVRAVVGEHGCSAGCTRPIVKRVANQRPAAVPANHNNAGQSNAAVDALTASRPVQFTTTHQPVAWPQYPALAIVKHAQSRLLLFSCFGKSCFLSTGELEHQPCGPASLPLFFAPVVFGVTQAWSSGCSQDKVLADNPTPCFAANPASHHQHSIIVACAIPP